MMRIIRLASTVLATSLVMNNAIGASAALVSAATTASAKAQVQATTQDATPLPRGTLRPVTPVKPKPRPKASAYAGIGLTIVNVHGFTGLMPKVTLGYGSLIGRDKTWYMGAEVFTGVWTIPLSPNQYYRTTNIFGASVLPGYQASEQTLYFARFGVDSAHFDKFDSNVGGLFGLGVQMAATRNWDVRVEYDFATNKSINLYNLDLIYHFFK